ncbi:hypothetical protein ACFL0V_04135 [Nanoarchaeota archaeon]
MSDADGDWDTANVTINVGALLHDVAVTSITHSEVGSTAYLMDNVGVTSDVQNQGTADELVTVELEVNGVVVNSTSVFVTVGSTVPVTLSYDAASLGTNNVIMRAQPVASETDMSDQTQATLIEVWSVDDIISMATREVFLSTNTIIVGQQVTVFLPLQNSYAAEVFYDLPAELWSSNLGAFTLSSPQVVYVDFGMGAFEMVQWNVTPNAAGSYDFSAILGNNELDENDFVQKTLTVV